MIFKQIAEVLRGRKTMTQRIVQDGEYAVYDDAGRIIEVRDKNGRLKIRVGGVYAAVPKRGMKGVGHVRVTSIQQPHVQEMTLMAAIAEGVNSVGEYQRLWDSINDRKGKRWADNPRVWRYRFEAVQA
jgi:hypothetical protein